MNKLIILFLSVFLTACQSYLDSDSKLFEFKISQALKLSTYDLIVKCQHGSLVNELNIEFINGECVLTKDFFYFYVQEPTTNEHRLAHQILLKDIKSFGLIDITSNFRQDIKISQLQIRGKSFTYVNNMKTEDALFFTQALRLSNVLEIQPLTKIQPNVPATQTNINIIIPSKK